LWPGRTHGGGDNEGDMEHVGNGKEAALRHLHEAIDRLCQDADAVEFWADAVAGFAEPVPDYEPSDMSVWLPAEQASALRRTSKS
jgi:hypothetical protein